MNLHILFAQRRQSYDGEHAPEALLCWTEFDVDENPDGFDEAVAEAQKAPDFTAFRVILVKVDGDKIDRLLNRPPVIQGEIEES